jgi:hypothetical protein
MSTACRAINTDVGGIGAALVIADRVSVWAASAFLSADRDTGLVSMAASLAGARLCTVGTARSSLIEALFIAATAWAREETDW